MGKVTINYRNIAILKRGFQKAIGLTAEAIKTDVIDKQMIPFDKSTLQESTFIDDKRDPNKAYIVSSTPYARRLYYHPEYNFQKKITLMQGLSGLSRGPLKVNTPDG